MAERLLPWPFTETHLERPPRLTWIRTVREARSSRALDADVRRPPRHATPERLAGHAAQVVRDAVEADTWTEEGSATAWRERAWDTALEDVVRVVGVEHVDSGLAGALVFHAHEAPWDVADIAARWAGRAIEAARPGATLPPRVVDADSAVEAAQVLGLCHAACRGRYLDNFREAYVRGASYAAYAVEGAVMALRIAVALERRAA
jgi:hypothetical protein